MNTYTLLRPGLSKVKWIEIEYFQSDNYKLNPARYSTLQPIKQTIVRVDYHRL